MNFEKIKTQALKRGDKGWKYSNKWSFILYDEKENACYVSHQKRGRWNDKTNDYEDLGMIPLSESPMIFRSDNTVELNTNKPGADYQRLRAAAINGRIVRSSSYLSHFEYIHDCTDRYEVVPHLRIDLATSKPVNARPFEDIEVDYVKRMEVERAIKEMRTPFLTLWRADPESFKQRLHKDGTKGRKGHREDHYDNHVKLIARFVNGHIRNIQYSNFTDIMFDVMHFFYTYRNEEINRFDNAMRFYKAGVFRKLGVVK